jgi:hypothetical protein
MGGQENAQKLISRLEDGLEQEQAMARKYPAAKTPASLLLRVMSDGKPSQES